MPRPEPTIRTVVYKEQTVHHLDLTLKQLDELKELRREASNRRITIRNRGWILHFKGREIEHIDVDQSDYNNALMKVIPSMQWWRATKEHYMANGGVGARFDSFASKGVELYRAGSTARVAGMAFAMMSDIVSGISK